LNDLIDFCDYKGINRPVKRFRNNCVPMTTVSTTKPATKTPTAKGGTTR
jgi:hypothetical protein